MIRINMILNGTLMEYREKHGDCKVLQHCKENKALGKWVARQCEQYNCCKGKAKAFFTDNFLLGETNFGPA